MNVEDVLKRVYSVEDFQYADLETSSEVKLCAMCGKKFIPLGKARTRQRFCKRTHYINCIICGAPVRQSAPTDRIGEIKQTCSRKCSIQYRANRTKEAIVEKYGVENISQHPDFKEKISAGIKAKAPETTAKVVATMKERYGGMGTSSPILRKKIEKTIRERYGVDNVDELPEIREKISNAVKSEKAQEKRRMTSRQHYGTDYPAQSEIIQIAMMQTLMERYGVPYSGNLPEAREKARQTCEERYGVPYGFHTEEAKLNARNSMIANRTGRVSQVNLEFIRKLNDAGVPAEPERYVAGKWYDVDLHRSDLTIEINPTYTHSDLPNHYDPEGKPVKYHLDRTEFANAHGYHCVHVFEWEDVDKIISLFTPKTTYYARQCTLKAVSSAQAKEFLQDNHLQGDARGAKYCYGLFLPDTDELLSIMTFSKPRYNKNYEWELLRLCTRKDCKVVGGASRMFKQFIRDAEPQSVISYCDRAKFTGSVYSQLGFTLHHTTDPAKIWHTVGPYRKIYSYLTDNLVRARGVDALFGTDYGKGTSNEALLIQMGYRSVYDCGQYVFEWRADS